MSENDYRFIIKNLIVLLNHDKNIIQNYYDSQKNLFTNHLGVLIISKRDVINIFKATEISSYATDQCGYEATQLFLCMLLDCIMYWCENELEFYMKGDIGTNEFRLIYKEVEKLTTLKNSSNNIVECVRHKILFMIMQRVCLFIHVLAQKDGNSNNI